MTQAFTLHANDTNRVPIADNCIAAIRALPPNETHRVEIKPVADKRSSNQNRKMWAMLGDISRQIPWTVNGIAGLITPDDWKDLITASLAKHQRIAQGLEGGVVMLGSRTSEMKKKDFAALIEYIYYVGADKGVVWDEASQYINEQADQMAA